MHLTYLIVVGPLPPLQAGYREQLTLDLDERVNLFIGPNASGKSTILRAIKDACSVTFRHNETDGDLLLSSLIVGLSDGWDDDWPRDSDGDLTEERTSLEDTMPFILVPATRVNLPTAGVTGGFGIDDPLDTLFQPGNETFQGKNVQSAIDWLAEEGTVFPRVPQSQLRRALEIGYSCAKNICSEIIRDDIPHPFPELSDKGRVVHYGLSIGTNDSIDEILGEPLYAGVLSSGTQGTLLWIYALALKIAHHYDWQEGWEGKPAILLIDEIENHLHPTWQRRVIPALLEHFPGLQVFATTHSPFVVAGLKAGQVHLLKRGEDGVVTAETNSQDIIGWTMDEILRTMMGVDDPTDQQTAEAAEELRALRNGVPAPTEAEEEKRQERIRELRRKVDRDLLAGGPAAAQREIFEEQFAAALEKHRQSRGLNQENG